MKYTQAVILHNAGSLFKEIGTMYWIVDREFEWWINYNTQIEKVIVESWFRTNLGSIPRFFWLFFNPTEYISYCLHDKLYTDHYVEHINGTEWAITRKEADNILYEALLVEWCGKLKALCIYFGVRIWWKKNW